MAHSCPYCDSLCHCGGDFDDFQLNGTVEEMYCIHCPDPDDCEDDPDDDFWDEEESTHTYHHSESSPAGIERQEGDAPDWDEHYERNDPNDSRNL